MTPLAVGITCYPTFGGSGIIATEIGLELARRGHRVHFICSSVPWRLPVFQDRVFLHEVETRDYPLFDHSSYVLALASKMVEVATFHHLDLLHVHYAIPHATAGYLAQQILGKKAPKLITTLHGTDITLVGNDRSFLPITRFSVEKSDCITVPSQFLATATRENLSLPPDFAIEVISNFVDPQKFVPPSDTTRGPIIVHNSNFRPVKRVEDTIQVLAAVRAQRPCRLVLIGDGPERSRVERLVRELGLIHDVVFLGKQIELVEVLQTARVFLQPSESESFGLAALEAMSCGVPVVGTRVGGVAEVVDHGRSGFLFPIGDIAGMTAAVVRILDDEALFTTLSARSRQIATTQFALSAMVDKYEATYQRVLAVRSST